MAIRAFGRLLFSGVALPKLDPKIPNSGGKHDAKPLFAALRSKWVLRWMVPGLAFMVLLASTQTSNAASLSSNSNQCQVEVGSLTGVSIALYSNKCVITFSGTGSHTWTAPTGVTTFDTLVVAGGGGGGADGGSGGGSGSLYEATINVNGNTGRQFAISVGVGGTRLTHAAVNGEAHTPNGSAGGNSSITQSGLGFSITTYGGNPGAWPASNYNVAGGSGGSQPVANAGSASLTNVGSHAGRQGATTGGYNWAQSGLDGAGGVTSSLFSGQFIGSGASGAHLDGYLRPGGSGGAGGGGRGGGGNASDGWADYFAGHGETSTGGGGGGGSRNGNVEQYTIDGRSDRSRNGGTGGSGVVKIAYIAPSLSLTTSANGARVGVDMLVQPAIQLKNSANSNFASSGVVVTAAVTSGTGVLSGATATTNSSGVAQFTNLGFTSGTLGTLTLTYSAPGYVNTTQTIKLQTLSTNIEISTLGSSNGNFTQGVWLADAAATSNIQASALAAELALRNVTIETRVTDVNSVGTMGQITFSTNVVKSSGGDQNLTLKANKDLNLPQFGLSSTSGKLNVVLWADSDSTNGGNVKLFGSSSSSYMIDTNGGHLAIGGGSSSTTWNGLTIPSGYAQSNTTYGGSWWGVEMGVNQDISGLKLIKTNGGNLRIYGDANSPNSSQYGIAWEGGEINTGSGSVELNGKTSRDTSDPGGLNYGVGIGANRNSANDIPRLVTTSPVTITGTTAGTYSGHQGVYVGYADFNAGTSQITITSNRQVKLDTSNTFASPVSMTSAAEVLVSAAQTFNGAISGTSVSLVSSGANVVIQGAITAGGDIGIYGSSISNTASITSSSGDVLLKADTMALGTSVNISAASGTVTIAPKTDNLEINLGSETSGKLSLVAAELNRLSASAVRIGAVDGTNSGTINITAALTPLGTDTLALRTSGSVIATTGSSITVAYLGIEASFVNLPANNSVTGGLALSASGGTLTYNQTGSFTPGTVDLIDPVYGVPSKVVMSQVPTSEPVDKFMAVAFNPPPVATLQDSYSKTLTSTNTSSDDYTITATKASGPGNLTGTTSVATSTTGVATFSNLSVSDTAGAHTITFTASVTPTRTAQISGTPTATSGTYNIQIDQTVTFTSTAPTNARATGASYTPTATATSSLTPVITVDASASAVCSISAGVVTFQSAGTCVLNANQPGNSSYGAAPQVQQSFSVAVAKLTTPSTPTVTATSNTLKSIAVSWTAVTDASNYTVKVYNAPGTGSAAFILLYVNGTSTTLNSGNFTGIADGTEYYISVAAISAISGSNSDESTKASVTTRSPAVTPTIETQPISQSIVFGQSVTFSIGATKTDNGVLSYQWQKAGSNITGATSSSYSIANVAAADAAAYSVVVTNSLNGTTATATSTSVNLAVIVNVTYDSQGGSSVSSATMNVGGSIATAPVSTRVGYTLSGWSRTTSGSVVSFTGGYAPADTSGFTLYAIWSANSNTIVYDSQGGTAIANGSMLTGGSIATAPAPTRAGYTLSGWSRTSSGSVVSFTGGYAPADTSGFTLYAIWSANSNTIVYDSQGGTAVANGSMFTAGSIATAPVSTRVGYTLSGWSRTIAGDVVSFAGSGYAPNDTAGFTLYAIWSANTLDVTFDSRGGSLVTASTTTTGASISAAPTAPTRAGYTFAGWFANSNVTGSAISFSYAHGQTDDFTLYAKWTANLNTIVYDAQGGSSVANGSMLTAGSIASAPVSTRAGYTLSGWSRTTTGSVVSFSGGYAPADTSGFTLYAIWNPNSNIVGYNSQGGSEVNDGTVLTGGAISSAPVSTRAGYTLTGWSRTTAGSVVSFAGSGYAPADTSSFTLYAIWSANSNTIVYNAQGGSSVSDGSMLTGGSISSAPVSTRAGYTLLGWSRTSTGSVVSFAGSGYAPADTAGYTLYAIWSANTLNVTYQLNDGTGGTISRTTTTGSDIASAPSDPTFPGFEFLGWSTTETGTVVSFPYAHAQTANFTLHARWKAGSYTVVYQYNGATGGGSTSSTTYETDIARTGITLPTPTKTAYTFAGWFTDLGLTAAVTLRSNGNYLPTTTHTIYAKWNAIPYQAIYNTGSSNPSGSVPVDSRTYTIGQNISLLGNSGLLARSGYTFAGWLTSPSSSSAPLNSGDTVTVNSAHVNFYPKWTANTYTISYNLNGGSGSLSGAPTSYTSGNSPVTLPSSGFTRTGYNFGGWSQTQGSSTAVANSFATFNNENLFAIWSLKDIGYSYSKGIASSETIAGWPSPDSLTGKFGSAITLPNLSGTTVTVSGTGYLFFGWSDGTTTYRSGDTYVLTEAVPVFTAQWVKLLDVRYSFGGGTKAVSDVETTDVDAECDTAGLCTPDELITLRGAATRPGYIFGGWIDQLGTVRAAGSQVNVVETNYLFYAKWTAEPYSFIFNAAGGSAGVSITPGTIGQLLTMPDPGARTGYTFAGWSPDSGTTKYSQGATFTVGTQALGFEAIWTPNVYTIVYDWQGATGSSVADSRYTVGTGNLTLPSLSDQVKDGYTFAGWSATAGGTVVSNYQPTATGVLYAKWVDGNYTLTYNAQNGPTPTSQSLVPRGTSTTLPTPTRVNFSFLGWFDALTGGNMVGDAGDSHQPVATSTLYARWVQSSFAGVDEAALETATTFTSDPATDIDTLITHNPSGSSARIQIPGGTLPTGTVISVRYFKDAYRQQQMIGQENNYFFSIVVSWLLGTGPTATVPDTNFVNGVNGPRKPITVTLSNTGIRAGAMVYQVIDGVVTELKRATVDGSIQVEITSDPELVIAATAPTTPRTVSAVSGSRNSSIVSWGAPTYSGGSSINNYDVLVNGNVVCLATTALSCDLSNLTDGTTYNVSVIARNAVGESTAGTTTFTTASAPGVTAPGSENQLPQANPSEVISSPDAPSPSTEFEPAPKEPESGSDSAREDNLPPAQFSIFARPETLATLFGLFAGLALWVSFARRRKPKNPKSDNF